MYKHIIQNILLIVVHVKVKIFVLLIDYLVFVLLIIKNISLFTIYLYLLQPLLIYIMVFNIIWSSGAYNSYILGLYVTYII